MSKIKIEPIHQIDKADIERLNFGYTSQEKYVVCKQEHPEHTVFQLELIKLEQPYIKRWETDDAEYELLCQAVSAGFSWAAYDGSEMIGIVIGEPRHWNRSLWVWEFHVTPSHQGRGIGRRLMDVVYAAAHEANLRTLICETQNTNIPAITVYCKLGFEIEGVDLSYYTNDDIESGEVAIFMKRKVG